MATNDNVVYPAILHYAEDGISIIFPDLPGCCPCAHTTQIALQNAKEAMGLHLWGMEQDNEKFPDPTPIEGLVLKENEIPVLIEVFMPTVRYRLDNRFIKKTLSIPAWLNAEAERVGINFSGVLQTALKEQLRVNQAKTQDKGSTNELVKI